jgi:glutamate formiminotransferase
VPTDAPLLVAAPNLSEGRDLDKLERLQAAVAPARVLDVHVDPDHNRSVFTLAARQGDLADGLAALASAVVDEIDLRDHEGVHPTSARSM